MNTIKQLSERLEKSKLEWLAIAKQVRDEKLKLRVDKQNRKRIARDGRNAQAYNLHVSGKTFREIGLKMGVCLNRARELSMLGERAANLKLPSHEKCKNLTEASSITELHLSVRACNAVVNLFALEGQCAELFYRNHGITIGQLASKNKNDLLKIRNCGQITALEIMNELSRCGFRLQGE